MSEPNATQMQVTNQNVLVKINADSQRKRNLLI